MTHIDVNEEIFDGYPWRPTKPLTMHQLQIGDLLAKGCRPEFVRAIWGWLQAGRATTVLLHAETPAEATILSLLMKRLDMDRETGKDKLEVRTDAAAQG
jgi:hypothetical protein